MKALIVDDSRLARSEIHHILKKIDTISSISEANSVDNAKIKIASENPDIIFLDIQMPEKDGFWPLKRVSLPLSILLSSVISCSIAD